jgi:hypothetical protein
VSNEEIQQSESHSYSEVPKQTSYWQRAEAMLLKPKNVWEMKTVFQSLLLHKRYQMTKIERNCKVLRLHRSGLP